MSITINQYQDLKLGERITFNGNIFEVAEDVDAIEDNHILISPENGERLYGAIYITHLIDLAGANETGKVIEYRKPIPKELKAAPHSEGINSTSLDYLAHLSEATRDELMRLTKEELGVPDFDLFYSSETVMGRTGSDPYESHLESINNYLIGTYLIGT